MMDIKAMKTYSHCKDAPEIHYRVAQTLKLNSMLPKGFVVQQSDEPHILEALKELLPNKTKLKKLEEPKST